MPSHPSHLWAAEDRTRGFQTASKNNMALNVIWLDDPASGKRELVGGKAANLNQLNGCVPPGFCITASAMARVMPVRRGEASLPPDLYAEIEAAYAELGARDRRALHISAFR